MKEPKIGDIKKCGKCGEEKAKYDRISSDARVGGEAAPHPQRPGDQYAWFCAACGFEDRVPS